MKHLRNGWVIAGVLLGTTALALAEEITLTTYYPSPRGVYNQLRAGTLVLQPMASAPSSPVEGMMYVNNSADTPGLWIFMDQAWKRFVVFVGSLMGKQVLGADYELLTTMHTIGGVCGNPNALCVNFTKTKAGLYQISWGGTVDIDPIPAVVNPLKKPVTLQVIYADSGNWYVAWQQAYYGAHVDPTSHDIDGSTIISLRKNGTMPRIQLRGKKSTGTAARVKKGALPPPPPDAWIQVDFIAEF